MIDLTSNFASTSTFLMWLMISWGASSFEWRNRTHVYLERLSTIARAYRFLDIDMVLTGLNKSICINWRGSVILDMHVLVWIDIFYFPLWHDSYNPSWQNSIWGRPLTNSHLIKEFIVLKFRWDSLLCHNQLSSDDALP